MNAHSFRVVDRGNREAVKRIGSPTGPQGQPDFWNYDPATGVKIADYSPGVAPEGLATLWSAGQ